MSNKKQMTEEDIELQTDFTAQMIDPKIGEQMADYAEDDQFDVILMNPPYGGSVFSSYTSITTNILFFENTGKTENTWIYRLDMPAGYKHFSKTKPMKAEHFAPVVEWWNDRREISEDGFDKARCYTYEQLTSELGYNLDQCGYHHKEEILEPMDLIQCYQKQRASLNAEIDNVLAEITAFLGGGRDE